MTKFTYEAATKKGKRVKGTREAKSRDEVARSLHSQELVVISISESIGIDFSKLGSVQIGGVPLKEKVIFSKQLSTMLAAGLPLIQALDILVKQTENQSLQLKLQNIYNDVEAGTSLSEAFMKESSIFNEIQINLLVAGEQSGKLNEVMAQIAEDMEKSQQLRSKILGAMIYPVIIFVVMIVVLAVMLVFMIPSVKDLYSEFGVDELPGITQALVNVSDAVTQPAGIVIILSLSIFGFLGFRYYYSTEAGRRVIDKVLLRVPIFGSLNRKIQLSQFNRLFSMLLRSGVPIVNSLQIVAKAMGNKTFEDIIIEASKEVIKGNSITIPLAKDEVFPLIMLKMLATGEETGKMDQVTYDMGKFYEAEVEEITNNLTKLMEPIILLTVGLLVGFMAVSIYLPLYQIGQYIG